MDIIKSWKNFHVKGFFYLIKYTDDHNLFLNEQQNLIYGVKDILIPFENYFTHNLPAVLNLVLLPFDNTIIYDGLSIVLPISLNINMIRSILYSADKILKKNNIICKLD